MTGIGVRPRFALLVLLALACASAGAQPYPSKPLKVILPVPAGGYYDTVTRIVSQRYSPCRTSLPFSSPSLLT